MIQRRRDQVVDDDAGRYDDARAIACDNPVRMATGKKVGPNGDR